MIYSSRLRLDEKLFESVKTVAGFALGYAFDVKWAFLSQLFASRYKTRV